MHKLCISCIAAAAALSVSARAQERADVCMAIGLDASGSIDTEEMRLQYDGLAAAIADRRFVRAINGGSRGLIAISVFTWADSAESVQIALPWTGLKSGKDAQAVAALFREMEHRQFFRAVRSTSLTVALHAGAEILAACPWFADRQLLNVAGDGHTNVDPQPNSARDSAFDNGIVINGIAIGGDPQTTLHYRQQVIGPPNIGFLVEAADYNEFAQAMINKLLLELAGSVAGDRISALSEVPQ